MSSDEILTLPPPPADARLSYGTDPNQFGDLRVPTTKPPFPLALNIHGGYWRAKYDLAHAGHLCAALTAKGIATWNIEYRRVGNPGGGWPGTFEDIRSAYRYLPQIAKRYNFDPTKILVMGHSAGGQLALCLAAHESSLKRVISLAGVLDLQQAWEQHLSDDAVVEFLGGKPKTCPNTIAKPIPCNSP
jgi:acetyl esterase/lipase